MCARLCPPARHVPQFWGQALRGTGLKPSFRSRSPRASLKGVQTGSVPEWALISRVARSVMTPLN